jgi:para-aminobenzoate synthetase/4-amino-4-deoxychorismate lyase
MPVTHAPIHPIIVLHEAEQQQWLLFSNPIRVFETYHPDDVLPTLETIAQATEQGYYAAGFLSYEAAIAFDVALRVRPDPEFPLLWFGLFPPPESLTYKQLGHRFARLAYDLGQWKADLDADEFDQIISKIKYHIAEGDTFQVNYSFRLKAQFEGQPWALFWDLMRSQPGDYGAFIDTGRYAICSASPELFFRQNQRQIMARPMKGTTQRGMTLEGDRQQAWELQQSAKNRAENVMIVDMIRNDLGRIAETGSVQVAQLFQTERYPTLWQMTSMVTAETDASFSQIMANLFPCASITGAPKPRTMDIIADLETSPRRIYTGTIGYTAPGRISQFNVAIRTVLLDRDRNQAEYGIGSGIVWDSQSYPEYEECRLKAAILTEKRPEFSLLETLLWTPDEGYFLRDYHLQRLENSAEYFGFSVDREAIAQSLENQAREFASEQTPTQQKVRLLVNRAGVCTLEYQAIQPTPMTTLQVQLAPVPVDAQNPFLYHKTTHRQVYETAKATCPDCDDVVLWNQRREVTESCFANVVVPWQGRLLTPPVHCGLLAGTFRQWLLAQQRIEAAVITIEMLRQVPYFYLINSVRRFMKAKLQSAKKAEAIAMIQNADPR